MSFFPSSVDMLIDELDKRFPEPAIGPDDTMDKIKFDAGQRSVVTYLKRWRAQAAAGPAPPQPRGQGRRVRSQDA
jgi:hypothetical protein